MLVQDNMFKKVIRGGIQESKNGDVLCFLGGFVGFISSVHLVALSMCREA